MDKRTAKSRHAAVMAIANTKIGRWEPRDPTTPALFADVGQPVTDEDVRRWLAAVPRLDPDSPRAAAYVRGQNVAGKIARAKAAGTFERIVDGRAAARLAGLPFDY